MVLDWMAVLALGFVSGQYGNPEANTYALGPVTGPIRKHNEIFLMVISPFC